MVRRKRENRISRDEYEMAVADLKEQLARGYINQKSYDIELRTLRKQAGRE